MTVLTKPAQAAKGSSKISIAGVELELFERGQGAPMLYLHGGGGIGLDLPFLDLLAEDRRVVAPSHPGFGQSSLPDWLDSIDDIAHIYLELMDRVGLTRTDLVGFSIGGWIAAELATKVPERISRLVLIGPVGVKTGRSDKLDIPDVFAMPREKLDRLRFHDPAKNPVDLASLPDEELHNGRPQQRDLGAADLGAVHAQSQAQAPAAPGHRRRRCSCAAPATASSRPNISRVTRRSCRRRGSRPSRRPGTCRMSSSARRRRRKS